MVNIGNIIGIMIGLVIGVSLIVTVATSANEAVADGNVTGATSTMAGLVPVIFVAVIIMGAVVAIKAKK